MKRGSKELRATIRAHGDLVTISLEGRLEDVAPGALGDLVQQLPPPDHLTAVVDLTRAGRLGGIGAAAVSTLVGGLEERGFPVRIRIADPAQRRVLETYGRAVEEPEVPARTVTDLMERLGERTLRYRDAAIRYLVLLQQSLRWMLGQTFGFSPSRWGLTLRSIVHMGVNATPLVALIAFLIGFILALHAAPFLRQYGQELRVADLVGLSITKEIAPLLTAILVAGRSGSSLTAEIGTMRVSEEVDAMEVMGVHPVGYLVAPRLRAMLIVLPSLTVMADVVGISGGLAVAHHLLDIPGGVYIEQTKRAITAGQVFGGLIKAFFFGLVIVSVAAFQGFTTGGGAAGVGKFTTRSVVQAIIWIIVVDAIFTMILTAMDW